ncbi:phage baseplate plug family protein [Photorhabdus asymbiotica]|uniref:phage baseplate plug family protein n=1 Tax=Photorhabdus asymbiotica TaxID=291112 RepID=UPI003DA76DF0
MAGIVEIPLSPINQQFDVQLDGINYKMKLIWRDIAGWILDIMTPDSEPIVTGLPLVFGANLLEQHRHLGFNGSLIFYGDINQEKPLRNSLGEEDKLYFVTN